uniref:Uncharacterized protein n=1 Tax=Arundo donax TaxID=35708 RepID=A0A0A8XP49_ARUDO
MPTPIWDDEFFSSAFAFVLADFPDIGLGATSDALASGAGAGAGASGGSLLKICIGRRTLLTSYTATGYVDNTLLLISGLDHIDFTRTVPMLSVRLSVYCEPAKVATGFWLLSLLNWARE